MGTRQSHWIDVKDRLPEEGEKVIVMYELYGRTHCKDALFHDGSVRHGKWYDDRDEVLAWMPVPSFDEILEANKDVLERIKRRGG